MVGAIRAARPDVVLNMVVGDSNVAFYSAIGEAGLRPRVPVLAFNIAEDELRQFPPGDVTGHYAAWSYFQSLGRPRAASSSASSRRGTATIGPVSDAMVAAYNGVLIWAQAANEAETADPKAVLEHFDRQSLDAPEGIVTIDPESRVAWRPCFVGRARPDGQFDVVWSLAKPNHPETYVGTRSRVSGTPSLGELKAKWGGRWSASEPAAQPPRRSTCGS